MGVFDYKDQSNSQAVHDAKIVQAYVWNASGDTVKFGGEDGWKVLTAEDLNYSGYSNSEHHQFYGEQPLYISAESNVLGKYDENGKLVSIGISFWGTGTSGDDPNLLLNTVLDGVQDVSAIFGDGEYYASGAFSQLINCVKVFAQNNGLTGEDIIITGHSLGGMAVNSFATLSAGGEWEGFFENSSYVAFASPTQNLVDNKVLNIGYENDPIFRVLEGHNFSEDSLSYHDKAIETATNNIVSFDEFYAGLNEEGAVIQSLLNSGSWDVHSGWNYSDGVDRILASEAYEYTHRDSTIVVSTLSEENRQSVWVEDLHRSPVEHTGTTFIMGSETADLIRGGSDNDYLSGLDGNDTFSLSAGYDVIYGGSGENTVQLESSLDHYAFAKSNHNEIYFKNNDTGMITKTSNIDLVTASDNPDRVYKIGDSGLSDGVNTINYGKQATSSFNVLLTASGDDQWVFIPDNLASTIVTNEGDNNVIVSGEKDSLIYNSGKIDTTLIFSNDFGKDYVYGLNATSTLVFMENENIAVNDSYLNHVSYVDGNTLLTFGDSYVALMGVNESLLSQMNIQLV